MNKLIDKLFLAILVLVAVTGMGEYQPIIILLISIISSCILHNNEDPQSSAAFTWCFGAACLVFPELCCGCSLITYDIAGSRKFYRAIPFVICFALNYSCFSMLQWAMILLSIMLSFISRLKTDALNKAENDLISLRDASAEVEILLTEKNQRIIEHQNSEIYMATLKERNRIAREIHDNVGHMLTRTILQMGALIILNKDETQKEALNSVKDTLSTAMTNIRQSVHDLHDESVDLKLTLKDCLKSLENKFTVSADLDISETVPRTVKICIIGVVKEAASNILKHSDGSRVWVSVREHPAFYQAVIKDDGCCTEQIKENGIGLINMRDRAAAVGGIATFTAGKNGFKVFLSIPKEV